MSGGGDCSNPGKERTFFSFHSAQALQLRDGQDSELPLPSLNQPNLLQIDNRTEVIFLVTDDHQLTGLIPA